MRADDGSIVPARFARVSVRASTLPIERTTLTDNEGRYSIVGLAAGTYQVYGAKAAYLTTYFGAKRPAAPQGTPIRLDTRGPFGWRACRSFRDIQDGTSNTIFMAERAVGSTSSRRIQGLMAIAQPNVPFTPAGCSSLVTNGRYTPGVTLSTPEMGQYWASGEPEQNNFATVLPPNSASCDFRTNIMGMGITARVPTASSHHQGGVNVAMGDGTVRFINENINAGDVSFDVTMPSGESPYGVWGALGTIAGEEVIGDF